MSYMFFHPVLYIFKLEQTVENYLDFKSLFKVVFLFEACFMISTIFDEYFISMMHLSLRRNGDQNAVKNQNEYLFWLDVTVQFAL